MAAEAGFSDAERSGQFIVGAPALPPCLRPRAYRCYVTDESRVSSSFDAVDSEELGVCAATGRVGAGRGDYELLVLLRGASAIPMASTP